MSTDTPATVPSTEPPASAAESGWTDSGPIAWKQEVDHILVKQGSGGPLVSSGLPPALLSLIKAARESRKQKDDAAGQIRSSSVSADTIRETAEKLANKATFRAAPPPFGVQNAQTPQ